MGPTLKDFTFTPKGVRANRSRIDFFSIRDELLSRIKKCEILPHLGTTLMDHKAVTLALNMEKTKPRPYINPFLPITLEHLSYLSKVIGI